MTVDLNRLRAFVTIVDADGFQAAAKRLNVAQPWLSVQLRQLEDTLGYRLLARSRVRGVELTAEGEIFLPLARHVLRSFEELLAGSRQIARLRTSVLKLGTDPFTLHMPPRNILIADFMQRYPEVKLEITSAPPSDLYALLLGHELDLVICSEPVPEECQKIPLCTYQLGLLVPQESDLAGHRLIDLEVLRGDRVLTLAMDYHPPLMAVLAEYFDQFGIAMDQSPEPGYGATLRFAQVQRRPLATLDLPPAFHEIPSDMAFRPVLPPYFETTFSLVGLAGSMSKSATRLWALAQSMRLERQFS